VVKRGAHEPRSACAVEGEYALEIRQEFRQPYAQEIAGPPPGRRLLLLVRVAVAERVVGVKTLEVKIEDSELQLM
jgi:hypothetical protein